MPSNFDPDSSNDRRNPTSVRHAKLADAPSIASIYNHHVDLGESTFDSSHWTDLQVQALLAGKPPQVWLVAESDAGVGGWASARWYSLRHGYRFTLETSIYLAPAAVGTGMAHSLQGQLERYCIQHQIHHLVAKIAADNQRSMAFHYRHGYELVGIQKEVGQMDGDWKDVAILQKLLVQHQP